MENIMRSKRMEHVHSDIRGPLYVEAMQMREQGKDVLRLNTGNPATFGFGLPKSIENAEKQSASTKNQKGSKELHRMMYLLEMV